MQAAKMSMQDLHQCYLKLKSGEVILDVRSAEEFAAGHVPGSVNIPHEKVAEHLDDLRRYARIYLHCRSGGRATRATAVLVEKGLTNITCIGASGMADWISAGYPQEK